MTKSPSKRVKFVQEIVTEPVRATNNNRQPTSILRAKREPISFEERQEMLRNDLEIINILGRRDVFRKAYKVNNSGLKTVVEEIFEGGDLRKQTPPPPSLPPESKRDDLKRKRIPDDAIQSSKRRRVDLRRTVAPTSLPLPKRVDLKRKRKSDDTIQSSKRRRVDVASNDCNPLKRKLSSPDSSNRAAKRQRVDRIHEEAPPMDTTSLPTKNKKISRCNAAKAWFYQTSVNNNCAPPEFSESYNFQESVGRGKGYIVNYFAMPVIREHVEDDDEGANDEDGELSFAATEEECSNLAINQNEEQSRPTACSDNDDVKETFPSDVNVNVGYSNQNATSDEPIPLRRSIRIAKLATSLEKPTSPRRSERLKNKPRVDYSIFF